MPHTGEKATLLALILGAVGFAFYYFRKKDQATPAGTTDVKVDGQQSATVCASTPWNTTCVTTPPDNVKARAFGPAIASLWGNGPRYSCPIGSHVEYAGDGSAWCVLNTPAPQQRHTISIGTATVTVPTILNPLADLWNLLSGKTTPAMPPIEKRTP